MLSGNIHFLWPKNLADSWYFAPFPFMYYGWLQWDGIQYSCQLGVLNFPHMVTTVYCRDSFGSSVIKNRDFNFFFFFWFIQDSFHWISILYPLSCFSVSPIEYLWKTCVIIVGISSLDFNTKTRSMGYPISTLGHLFSVRFYHGIWIYDFWQKWALCSYRDRSGRLVGLE